MKKWDETFLGCELLSNYLILTYWNSGIIIVKVSLRLWIAFKLFNFDLLKQRGGLVDMRRNSCELLSNYLILTYWNSILSEEHLPVAVVNCFQTI